MQLDVVSYRGPGSAGGVSSGLECLWRNQQNATSSNWWYLGKRFLEKLSSQYKSSNFVTMLSEEMVAGHYRYCNEFLWPILHDLPEHATFNPDDQELYRQLNLIFANYIGYEHEKGKHYFVQDYQLALLPRFLYIAGGKSVVFWHIPWPKNVPAEFIQPLSEIARGLLRADIVGFHTAEYANNFIRFVWEYIPDFAAYGNSMFIHSLNQIIDEAEVEQFFQENNYITSHQRSRTVTAPQGTNVVVQPLGIDTAYWTKLTAEDTPAVANKLEHYIKTPFVLSVDRADYTKSVYERLQTIVRFFENNPSYIGRLTFIQISGRTRPGLAEFDKYWEKSQQLYKQICERFRILDWQPVVWIDEPLSPTELAYLYKQANIMLVNPVRDGLNLTAKEFVACQRENPGVLLLSEGAGAWHELGKFALSANPEQPEIMIKHILRALNMSISERRLRMDLMKEKLEQHTLNGWWAQFAKAPRQHGQRIPTTSRKLA